VQANPLGLFPDGSIRGTLLECCIFSTIIRFGSCEWYEVKSTLNIFEQLQPHQLLVCSVIYLNTTAGSSVLFDTPMYIHI